MSSILLPRPVAGHEPAAPTHPQRRVATAAKVLLATASNSYDFLKFAAVPTPGETAAQRFARHGVYYNALCCQFATLKTFPIKRPLFLTSLLGQISSTTDLEHLASSFLSLVAAAVQRGDTETVAAAQAIWVKFGAFSRAKPPLSWIAFYDFKSGDVSILSPKSLRALSTRWAGKALPSGFGDQLNAKAERRLAAPFKQTSIVSGAPHSPRPLATAQPNAAAQQVDPDVVTMMAALTSVGGLMALIGTVLPIPESGPIGLALSMRIAGSMVTTDASCSTYILRMINYSTSMVTQTLPQPTPVEPGDLTIDRDGNSCVEPPTSSSDPTQGDTSSTSGEAGTTSSPSGGSLKEVVEDISVVAGRLKEASATAASGRTQVAMTVVTSYTIELGLLWHV